MSTGVEKSSSAHLPAIRAHDNTPYSQRLRGKNHSPLHHTSDILYFFASTDTIRHCIICNHASCTFIVTNDNKYPNTVSFWNTTIVPKCNQDNDIIIIPMDNSLHKDKKYHKNNLHYNFRSENTH